MKREEERNKAALEAYPERISYSTVIDQNVDYNRESREIWLQGAEWADKTIIDKLEDWLANNICNAYNFRGDDISETFINDCIKAMKGE